MVSNTLPGLKKTTAVVIGIHCSSAMAFVTCRDSIGNQINLVGDRRTAEPLHDFIGLQVALSIRDSSHWTWSPAGAIAGS